MYSSVVPTMTNRANYLQRNALTFHRYSLRLGKLNVRDGPGRMTRRETNGFDSMTLNEK